MVRSADARACVCLVWFVAGGLAGFASGMVELKLLLANELSLLQFIAVAEPLTSRFLDGR